MNRDRNQNNQNDQRPERGRRSSPERFPTQPMTPGRGEPPRTAPPGSMPQQPGRGEPPRMTPPGPMPQPPRRGEPPRMTPPGPMPQPPGRGEPPRTAPPNFIPEPPGMEGRPMGRPGEERQFGVPIIIGPGFGPERHRPMEFRGCLNRFTFIWLINGNSFWFYPTFVDRMFVQGFRWRRNHWEFDRINRNRIIYFRCF